MKNSNEDKRSTKPILFVGLDVHKECISVALAEPGRGGEVRHYGTITNDLHAIEKLTQKLRREGWELRVCYEAGPCGFGLARRLLQLGVDCLSRPPTDLPIPLLLLGDCALADPEESGRPAEERQARRRKARSAAPGWGPHPGAHSRSDR